MSCVSNSSKIRLCLLDDSVDYDVLCDLVDNPFARKNIVSMRTKKGDKFLPVGHGTICMGVLLESLYNLGVTNCVDVFHYPLSDVEGRKNLSQLLDGLSFCDKIKADAVSISAGLFSRIVSRRLLCHLDKWVNKTLLVAAGSNDGRVVYPAAYSTVLGVKKSQHNTTTRFQRVENPLDGIDITMSCQTHQTLKLSKKKYGVDYFNYNSVLAPELCAHVAHLLVTYGNRAKDSNFIVYRLAQEKQPFLQNVILPSSLGCNDKPIILFINSDGKNLDSIKCVIELQRIFNCNNYDCAMLSDAFQETDHEKGHLRLNDGSIKEDFQFYKKALTDSLELVLVSSRNACEIDADMTYDMRRIVYQDLPFELYSQIVERFS